MNVIVAGSRDFKMSDEQFDKTLELLFFRVIQGNYHVVFSGTSQGPDKRGETWATSRGVDVKQFKPDWNGKGRGAGLERNLEMAKDADTAVVFWDGTSRGSSHMINTMIEKVGFCYVVLQDGSIIVWRDVIPR